MVDDEPLGRARIVSLLDKIAEGRGRGECETGAQAIEAIAARSPDLVFLDVQMPDDYAEDDLFTGGVDDITGDRVASGTARSTHG